MWTSDKWPCILKATSFTLWGETGVIKDWVSAYKVMQLASGFSSKCSLTFRSTLLLSSYEAEENSSFATCHCSGFLVYRVYLSSFAFWFTACVWNVSLNMNESPHSWIGGAGHTTRFHRESCWRPIKLRHVWVQRTSVRGGGSICRGPWVKP